MTITYPNGSIVEAIVLSHDENAIRAIAPSSQDVLAFTQFHGIWFSDKLEPITIEFEWQRGGASSFPAVDDCVCPQELAAKLIHMLFADTEAEEVKSHAPSVFTQTACG
ncbi:MAG: hypothetical protein ABI759_01540 [Candidatus Solibacter sp.]